MGAINNGFLQARSFTLPEVIAQVISFIKSKCETGAKRVLLLTVHSYYHLPVETGYVVAYLEKLKIPFHVIDLDFEHSSAALDHLLLEINPDLIHLSLGAHPREYRTQNFYRNLLKKIKTNDRKILLSGAVATLLGKETLARFHEADYAVKGDAQYAIRDLLKGRPLSDISGLIYREGETVLENVGSAYFDVTEIAFPRYEHFVLDQYQLQSIPIFLSLGCHHPCTYCFHPLMHGAKYRMRRLEDGVAEIKYWRGKGYRRFDIIDDNFGFSKKRLADFFDRLQAEGLRDLEISISNLRIDETDEELLALFRKGGVRELWFGVDHGNNTLLDSIRKNYSSEAAEKIIAAATKMKFDVQVNFTVGHPEETWKNFMDSIRLACKLPLKRAFFFNLVPIPGTELFEQVKKENLFVVAPEHYWHEMTFKEIRKTPLFRSKKMSIFEKKISLHLGLICEKIVRLRYEWLKETRQKMADFKLFILRQQHQVWLRILLDVLQFFYALGRWRIFPDRPIRIVPFPAPKPFDNKELRGIKNLLSSSRVGEIDEEIIRHFQKKFADFLGCRYAIAVSSGTAALHASLAAAGVQAGDEVIVPALSYISTAMVVLHQGAVPRFADTEPGGCNIDAREVEKLINRKTKAVIAAHLCGIPCDIEKLKEICHDRNIVLIEDASQSFGSSYQGRKVGTWGDLGCFSFSLPKNMTTSEGGMIVTERKDLLDQIRLAVNLGECDDFGAPTFQADESQASSSFTYRTMGWNYRMSDVQAAMGLGQLQKSEFICKKRFENGSYLLAQFKEHPFLEVPVIPEAAHIVFNVAFMTVKKDQTFIDRNTLAGKLRREGIPVVFPYPRLLPHYELFADHGKYPHAEDFSQRALGFSMGPQLRRWELNDIVAAIYKITDAVIRKHQPNS